MYCRRAGEIWFHQQRAHELFLRTYVRVCVCACVCTQSRCMCTCVRVYVRVCVCVRKRARARVWVIRKGRQSERLLGNSSSNTRWPPTDVVVVPPHRGRPALDRAHTIPHGVFVRLSPALRRCQTFSLALTTPSWFFRADNHARFVRVSSPLRARATRTARTLVPRLRYQHRVCEISFYRYQRAASDEWRKRRCV